MKQKGIKMISLERLIQNIRPKKPVEPATTSKETPAKPMEKVPLFSPYVVDQQEDNLEVHGNQSALFITDEYLRTEWQVLDRLEGEIVKVRGLSQGEIVMFLERTNYARELLLSDEPDHPEIAWNVQMANARLAMIKNTSFLQKYPMVFFYLLFILALLVIGFLFTDRLSLLNGNQIAGEPFDLIWKTMLWGGLGGVTGALYALWLHVARIQDYDPQYAMWYYTNPIMGVILGAFVHVVVRTGAFAFFGPNQSGDVNPLSYPVFFFAWAVGFQQNLVFSIVSRVLNFIMPIEKKKETDKAQVQDQVKNS